MNHRHNSLNTSASPSSSAMENLAAVPLLCNVLESQMHDESQPASQEQSSSRVSANRQSTENIPYNYAQQLINKNSHDMFQSPRDALQQKYERRPYRRQSLPGRSMHSTSNKNPVQGSFQPKRFDYHHQARPANLNIAHRHSNSPVHPLIKSHDDVRNLRNVPYDKPKIISNLDLESRNASQEELSNNSSSTYSNVRKSFSEIAKTETKSIPAVIDLTESDNEHKSTGANDTKHAPSSWHSGKTRMESLSEERDSVFDINNGPAKGIEQKEAKQTGVKRSHHSEAIGFNDNSYSTANKKMRRASGPDRFPSYPSSSTYVRQREKSRSTSPHPTDLPFTLDTLTEEIKKESTKCLQSSDSLAKKQRLRAVLETIFRVQFPGCILHLVGSSVNGLANEGSDADFCLMLTQWREIDQRSEARGILMKLNRQLRECNFVEGNQVIFATVPIIKFVDSVSKCECDININNHVGIRNTFLIKSYCKVDERVGPLVMVVKKWAKKHGINDSKDGTLSSYALTLMVLHYLQYACQPPVLPSLQKIYPDIFSENIDVNVLLTKEVEKIFNDASISKSQNLQTLGELLLGFFQYFANQFNWDQHAISVRLGHIYSKAYGKAKKKHICIEEPFDYNNVAKTVYNEENFNKIKMKISLAANKLKVSPSLQSIL